MHLKKLIAQSLWNWFAWEQRAYIEWGWKFPFSKEIYLMLLMNSRELTISKFFDFGFTGKVLKSQLWNVVSW